MTVAEVQRELKAIEWQIQEQDKRTAIHAYRLAELVGISVACLFDSRNQYPTLSAAYPHLFPPNEEEEVKKSDEASAARFLQFANAFNEKFKKKNL